MKVKAGGKKFELGLNLRKDREQFGVLGYSRWNSEWEYSPKTLDLLHEYIQTFPEFWNQLVSLWTQKKLRTIEYDAVFGRENLRTAERIALWVHYEPSQKLPWSAGNSRWLSTTPVPPMRKSQVPSKTKFWNPGLLFAESKSWVPPHTNDWTMPSLGSRVVNLYSRGGVPLGAEGTVVSVHGDNFVGVFFDEFVFNRAGDNTFVMPARQVLSLTRQCYHPLRKDRQNSEPVMKLRASAKEFVL